MLGVMGVISTERILKSLNDYICMSLFFNRITVNNTFTVTDWIPFEISAFTCGKLIYRTAWPFMVINLSPALILCNSSASSVHHSISIWFVLWTIYTAKVANAFVAAVCCCFLAISCRKFLFFPLYSSFLVLNGKESRVLLSLSHSKDSNSCYLRESTKISWKPQLKL